jgi:general stress protein 26
MQPHSEQQTPIHPPNAEAREQLWTLIHGIRFAMFITHDAVGGRLHARPMTTQNRSSDEDSSLWFFMSRGSESVSDLTANRNVSVVYADPASDSYVSISGSANLVEDSAKKERLWSKMAEAWFPGGPNDPDLALVTVDISHAEYWNVTDSKIVQLFKMAKAVVTGEPPTLGEHELLRLR